jgi:hypothetical protein
VAAPKYSYVIGLFSVPLHHLFSIVPLGKIPVVSSARELNISNAVISTKAKWPAMVELEASPFRAASAVRINVSTLPAVGNRRMHESFEPLQLVAKLGACR